MTAKDDDRRDDTAHIGSVESQLDGSSSSPSSETAILGDGPAAANLIDGRFKIERELGRGGFGITYLAADLGNNEERIVIKALLEQPEAKAREWIESHFRDEVKALSRIEHPGVVKLVGTGEMPDGRPYLAMEFVEGYDLHSQIEPERGLGEFERIAKVARELGEAISAAHDKGVYHRDLKPENIMLYKEVSGDETQERVKVIDFGISTVKETLDEKTRATVLAGSINYMAPEQIKGKPSASTDVYALGVIAYEMITGRVPFTLDTKHPTAAMLKLLEMQQAGVRVKPRDLRPSLPAAAQDAILKALSFNPSERYQRPDQFGNELAQALTQEESEEDGPKIRAAQLEMAYVLFMDIVGYSRLPMDIQRQQLEQLQQVVRDSQAFRRAQSGDQLVSLPTGDGMALAFFGDPMAAVHCAVEVARGLKQYPHVKLRTGLNMGPVYHVADINANRNIAGGGINIAQRVMDCGDAGHILLSQNVADMLMQLSEWREHLDDLGIHKVKHDVAVHLYNLSTEEVGNSEVPEKLRPAPIIAQDDKARASKPPVPKALIAAAALIVIAVVIVAGWQYFSSGATGGSNKNENSSSASGETGAPVRTLSFWAVLQKYRNDKPDGEPTNLTGGITGETYVGEGDGMSFYLESADKGHIYMINEEAGAEGRMPSYILWFPSPFGNNLSSEVEAGREVATSEIVFDAITGTEKVWIIWSAEKIDELEKAIELWANSEHEGKIKDAATIEFVRKLLEEKSAKLELEPDDVKDRMKLRGKGDILIYPLKLKHR